MVTMMETDGFEQKLMITEFEEIVNKSSGEEHKIITAIFYNQQKIIEKLLNSNKELQLELQQCKRTPDFNQENKSSSQVIMEKIWDNKEDEFWDTF